METPLTVGVQTPTNKRKAEEYSNGRRPETKKNKPTFVPSAATKTLKRTTPARGRAAAMRERERVPEPEGDAKKQMEVLFKDLGKSLSESITEKISEDFKQTFMLVGESGEE